MKIGLGADHAGFAMKEELKKFLEGLGHICKDFGTFSKERADYPDFGFPVAEAVKKGEVERGILMCGTGIGMSISANKVSGIRAALCTEPYTAKLSRQHNNANVLVLPAWIIGIGIAKEIVSVFLSTDFEGGRHEQRLKKIEAKEKNS